MRYLINDDDLEQWIAYLKENPDEYAEYIIEEMQIYLKDKETEIPENKFENWRISLDRNKISSPTKTEVAECEGSHFPNYCDCLVYKLMLLAFTKGMKNNE